LNYAYYLEFIDAYYYLIIVAYFLNYLEFKKVKSYVTKVYGLTRIGSILLSRSYIHCLGSQLERNEEVKRAGSRVV
jgi:hypothetical protein